MTADSTSKGASAAAEPILDPDLPIIDTHHHLFGEPLGPFPAYAAEDFLSDLSSGHNIRATVFVQAMQFYDEAAPPHLQPVGETRFINAVADRHADRAVCAAIIGHADLSLGDAVDEVLDAHQAAAPQRFRGIRDMVVPNMMEGKWVDEDRVMQRPSFRAGLRRLGQRGLLFETMAFHYQLTDLMALARALPDLTIVANHLGAPLHLGPYEGREAEVLEVWKQNMTDLAREPNVLMKLGGMTMWTTNFGWERGRHLATSDEFVAKAGSYFRHAIDAFGPDRCLFESNFPVDRLQVDYAVLWNAFKKIATPYSAAEKAAMFHDNAAKVYRIADAQRR